MSEPFLGQITMFGGNFAPRGWALCEGQLLPIAQNSALFSILGTTYGGDGRTTFGLPDLRGRVPIQQGRGPGLPDYRLGAKSGIHQMQLSVSQMPNHNHTLHAGTEAEETSKPTGNILAASNIYQAPPTDATLASASIGNTGGGQTFSIQNPFLAINFLIALTGTFPSRN